MGKKAITIAWAIMLITLAVSAPVRAQGLSLPIWNYYVGIHPVPGVPNAKFTASLADPAHEQARRGIAKVEVLLAGIDLVNPTGASSAGKPQGHLHYKLDNNPEICTVASSHEFNNLAPGQHKIVVTLVGNDHKSLGPQETFGVIVPKDPKALVFGIDGK